MSEVWRRSLLVTIILSFLFWIVGAVCFTIQDARAAEALKATPMCRTESGHKHVPCPT